MGKKGKAPALATEPEELKHLGVCVNDLIQTPLGVIATVAGLDVKEGVATSPPPSHPATHQPPSNPATTHQPPSHPAIQPPSHPANTHHHPAITQPATQHNSSQPPSQPPATQPPTHPPSHASGHQSRPRAHPPTPMHLRQYGNLTRSECLAPGFQIRPRP